MKLIPCPVCGRQLSSAAKACPQCGHPTGSAAERVRSCYACTRPSTQKCLECGCYSCATHLSPCAGQHGSKLLCESCKETQEAQNRGVYILIVAAVILFIVIYATNQ